MTNERTRTPEAVPNATDPGCDACSAEFPGLRDSRRSPDRAGVGSDGRVALADGHSIQYREGFPTMADRLKRFVIPEQLGVQHLIERVVMGRTEYIRADLVPSVHGDVIMFEGVEFVRDDPLAIIVGRDDLRRLVIAARKVAFDDPQDDSEREARLSELDAASEAFADRFDWPDQPEAEPSDPAVDGVAEMIVQWAGQPFSKGDSPYDLAERIVTGLRDQGIVEHGPVPSTMGSAANVRFHHDNPMGGSK